MEVADEGAEISIASGVAAEVETETEPREIVLADFETVPSEAVSSSQNCEQEVLGYLEVQQAELVDQGGAGIFAQEIEIDGQRLILTRGEEGNEIIVVVSSDQVSPPDQGIAHFSQCSVLNSSSVSPPDGGRSHPVIVRSSQIASEESEPGGSSDDASCVVASADSSDYKQSVIMSSDPSVQEGQKADVGEMTPLWTLSGTKLQERDDGTEVLFIPNPSVLSSNPELASRLLLSGNREVEANGNLMELANVAHEFQSGGNIQTIRVHEEVSCDVTDSSVAPDVIMEQENQIVSSSGNIVIETSAHVTETGVIVSSAEGRDVEMYESGEYEECPVQTSQIPATDVQDLTANKICSGTSVIRVTSASNVPDVNAVEEVSGEVNADQLIGDGGNTDDDVGPDSDAASNGFESESRLYSQDPTENDVANAIERSKSEVLGAYMVEVGKHENQPGEITDECPPPPPPPPPPTEPSGVTDLVESQKSTADPSEDFIIVDEVAEVKPTRGRKRKIHVKAGDEGESLFKQSKVWPENCTESKREEQAESMDVQSSADIQSAADPNNLKIAESSNVAISHGEKLDSKKTRGRRKIQSSQLKSSSRKKTVDLEKKDLHNSESAETSCDNTEHMRGVVQNDDSSKYNVGNQGDGGTLQVYGVHDFECQGEHTDSQDGGMKSLDVEVEDESSSKKDSILSEDSTDVCVNVSSEDTENACVDTEMSAVEDHVTEEVIQHQFTQSSDGTEVHADSENSVPAVEVKCGSYPEENVGVYREIKGNDDDSLENKVEEVMHTEDVKSQDEADSKVCVQSELNDSVVQSEVHQNDYQGSDHIVNKVDEDVSESKPDDDDVPEEEEKSDHVESGSHVFDEPSAENNEVDRDCSQQISDKVPVSQNEFDSTENESNTFQPEGSVQEDSNKDNIEVAVSRNNDDNVEDEGAEEKVGKESASLDESSTENNKLDSEVIVEESIIVPPKRTYARKKKKEVNVAEENRLQHSDIDGASRDIGKEQLEGDVAIAMSSSAEGSSVLSEGKTGEVPVHSTSHQQSRSVSNKSDVTVASRKRTFSARILRRKLAGDKEKDKSREPKVFKSSSASRSVSCSNGALSKDNTPSSYDPSSEYTFVESGNEDSSELKLRFNESSFAKRTSMELSPKKKRRGRPLGSRNQIKNTAETWDRFLKSTPPSKSKSLNYIDRFKKKCMKRASSSQQKSLETVSCSDISLSSSPVTPSWKDSVSLHRPGDQADQTNENRPKIVIYRKFIQEPERFKQENVVNYVCDNCGYQTVRVQNYIYHNKTCRISDLPCEASNKELRDRMRGSLDACAPGSKEVNKSQQKSSDVLPRSNHNQVDSVPDGDEDSEQEDEPGFAEDDVAWLERRNVYWPALVRCVYPKEKKASVYMIDFPGNKGSYLKVSLTKLHAFDNPELKKKLLGERKTTHGDAFLKAFHKAEEFVRKQKTLGMDIKVAEFFSGLPAGDPAEKNRKATAPVTTSKTRILSGMDLDRDGGSTDDTATVAGKGVTENGSHFNPMDEIPVDEIMDYIKGGKVDEHVIGVYRKTVDSERHAKFFSDDVDEKKTLDEQPWFGPIDDKEQQSALYDYLSNLFIKKCRTENTSSVLSYIFQVWCPEAIIKAISDIKDMPMGEAESLFMMSGIQLALDEKDKRKK